MVWISVLRWGMSDVMLNIAQVLKGHCTLNCFSKIISFPFLANYTLVDFASSNVVVTMKSYVKETFIVSKIQVNFPTIIKNVYLSC